MYVCVSIDYSIILHVIAKYWYCDHSAMHYCCTNLRTAVSGGKNPVFFEKVFRFFKYF